MVINILVIDMKMMTIDNKSLLKLNNDLGK